MTLDGDVEQRLREAMRRQGTSFKETLNDALRRGLGGTEPGRQEPFRVQSRPMGMRSGVDPAKVRDLDDDLEVEDFLRKTAQLSNRR